MFRPRIRKSYRAFTVISSRAIRRRIHNASNRRAKDHGVRDRHRVSISLVAAQALARMHFQPAH